MNKDLDVKKQLEVKNKEIYHNKLNLDIENNLEVLVLTIDNLLNSIPEMLSLKILEIKESFADKEEINNHIDLFVNSYRDKVKELIDNKEKFLKENKLNASNLEVLRPKLEKNYNEFKDKLEDYSTDLIKILIKSLEKYNLDEFKKQRLNSYLNSIFLPNLNKKILDIVKMRDTILVNTFNETYLKYLEINRNTIGIN